jgi:hypothetical protein
MEAHRRFDLFILGNQDLSQERTMITKHGLFLGYAAMPHTARLATGFAVLLLAAMFSFTGCPTEDDSGGGGGGGNTGVGLTVKLGASGNPYTLYALKDEPTLANVDSLIASAAGQSVATTTNPTESIVFYWATGKQPVDGMYYLVAISPVSKKAFQELGPTSVSIVGGETTTDLTSVARWDRLE